MRSIFLTLSLTFCAAAQTQSGVGSGETGRRAVNFTFLPTCGAGFSLRPISIGLPSNEAKAERPIEIGRRLKPAPQAHAVSRSVRKYIRQNVKLFLRQPLGQRR